MVEPGSRVLDVGCGDGALLALLRDRRGVDGRGIELSREGVNACLAQGPAGDPGRRRHRPRRLPRRRLRLRDPVADPAGDAPARASCSSTCCASAGGRSCPSRISAIGACATSSRSGAACRVTENLPLCLVRDAQHPFLHHPRFRRPVPRDRRRASSGRSRSMPAASRCASPCPGGCGTCSASRRCSS